MNKKNLILILIMSLLLILLGGCWDRIEIEDRGFILVIGLDWAAEGEKEGYTVTQQLVDPERMAGGSGPEGSGSSGNPFWNISTFSTDSVFDAMQKSEYRMYRRPYFSHLRLIVIGEDMAKKGITSALDIFSRHSQIRKKTKVFVTPTKAKEILEIKPQLESVNALYLMWLAEKGEETLEFANDLDLGKVIRNLHENVSFLIPRVEPKKNEAELLGAGLFKEGKLIAWLDFAQVHGILWVKNLVRGGTIVVSVPFDKESKIVSYDIENNTTKTFMKINDEGELVFTVNVRNEGKIVENQKQLVNFEDKYVNEVERLVSEKIEERIKNAIDDLQDKYRADAIGMGVLLERQYPDYWKEVKDIWEDEIFPTVKVEVSVKSFVRRVGVGR